MLAQMAGFSVGHWVIVIIVVAVVVGIMFVCLQQFGVAIPTFVIRIFWICVAAVIGVMAVKFLLSLG